jgi:DNA-binding GntR family transcriptional regulator
MLFYDEKAVLEVDEKDLAQKAHWAIREMLFNNEIVPGQKIAYRDLSERLGIGVTPITTALRWLEFQTLVHRKPNRGYYAETINIKEIEEIYDLRNVIENSLLPTTLTLLDEEGIERLNIALETQEKAEKERSDISKLMILDRAFHMTLASLSKCRTQQRMLGFLFDLLLLKYGSTVLFQVYIQNWSSEHRIVCERVFTLDLTGAQSALSHHLLRVKQFFLQHMNKQIAEGRIHVS